VLASRDIASIQLYMSNNVFFNRYPNSSALRVHFLEDDEISRHLEGAERMACDGRKIQRLFGGRLRLPTENVGVGACLEEQKRQFPVVLLPCHQPVVLDVALPLPSVVALQGVGVVFGGQLARPGKQIDDILDQLYVQAALTTPLQILFEAVGVVNAVHFNLKFA
jgi:hypothetical protein